MQLTSPEFAHNATMPSHLTCDGADLSPELHWSDVPEGTAELALTCEDPDAPSGTFVHWVLWGLDPAAGSVGAGKVPDEAAEGINGFGRLGYGGPCPPPGHGPHHYIFRLYALRDDVDVKPGSAVDQLRAAMEGNVLGEAETIGIYERAPS